MVTADGNDPGIVEVLRAEAQETVERIETLLLTIEREPEREKELVREILRDAHNLKGAASTAGLTESARYVHDWESCVQQIRDRAQILEPVRMQALYDGLDLVRPLIAAEAGVAHELPEGLEQVLRALRDAFEGAVDVTVPRIEVVPESTYAEARDRDGAAHLRVSVDKIDTVMNGVMELLALRASQAKKGRDSELLGDVVVQWQAQLEELRSILDQEQRRGWQGSQLALDRMRQLAAQQSTLAGQARDLSARLDDGLRADAQLFDVFTGRLQDDVRSIRLVPVEIALTSMPRMVRDLCRKLGKEANLVLQGADTELDRDVLDHVKSAVIHLLRNAIDHGIEAPGERAEAGKTRVGTVRILASSFGGEATIEVRDDGRGLSVQEIGHHALTRGIVEEAELQEMSDAEIRELVFRAGFTSASEVTDVSGRGVGLDAVRRSLHELGGRIRLESPESGGAAFIMHVPVSRASVDLLLVRVGEDLMAVPTTYVRRILRVRREEMARVDTGHAIEVDGSPVVVNALGDLLEVPTGARADEVAVVLVMSAGSELAAVAVDAVVDHRELLAKGLGAHLGQVENVLGTTVLADGEIVPVLNPIDLFRTARRHMGAEALFEERHDDEAEAHRILVVDDSITTRTLQKGILESAGYLVEVATDGLEALEKLGRRPVDLVLTDVEMPRMDGFQLTERIKANEKTRHLPVIIVSSLGSSEHRERGLKAGADAYVAKGEFEQGKLLATIERLI